MLVYRIEREHPIARNAVFPRGVRGIRIARARLAAETGGGVINTDVAQAGGVRKRVREIQAAAQDPSIGHPEIILRVDRHYGGMNAAPETIGRVSAQPVVPPGGEDLAHDHRGGRNPTSRLESR